MRVPTSQNQQGGWCVMMMAKYGSGLPEGSAEPTAARYRLSSVADPAAQTSGATEVFAVDWQLADPRSDVS